jgi:hypothetical protein
LKPGYNLIRLLSGRPPACHSVIAGAAKQSIAPQKESMDCFVAALLATTGGREN